VNKDGIRERQCILAKDPPDPAVSEPCHINGQDCCQRCSAVAKRKPKNHIPWTIWVVPCDSNVEYVIAEVKVSLVVRTSPSRVRSQSESLEGE